MKFNRLKLILVLCLGIFCISIFQGCTAKDKEIVISKDVAQDIKIEESQVEGFLKEGAGYLQENKFSEARNSFEEAVKTSISDKEIYLKIEEQYVKAERYDDAYYFINLAIKNNVDIENMNKLLIDIRNNMETVNLSLIAYVNQVEFNITNQVQITVDGKEYTDSVVWSDWNNDISNPGTYTYHGITKEYGRNVVAELNLKDLNESKMGFIRDTYIKDNNTYIIFDEVEFYTGQEAIAEAKKDRELPKDEDGKEFIPNGYYLRNSVEDEITLKLSEDALIKMCAFLVDPKDETTLPKLTDYDKFKAHVDQYKEDKVAERSLLFNIDIKHGLVKELNMQFTP